MGPITRRRFVALLGLTAASTYLLGCNRPGASGPSATTGPHGDLVVVQGVDVESLDPHVITSLASRGVIGAMYDPLVIRTQSMAFVPALARSWRLIDDQTWEFSLQAGVKFHNGEDFTADAVKLSVDRIMDPEMKNVYLSQFKQIKDVEIVDPHKILIHTDGPMAGMLDALSLIGIVPPKAVQSGLDLSQTAIGTGPYKFEEWNPSERLVMVAADAHFSGEPRMETVTWQPVAEAFTRITLLKTEAADIITPVIPTQVDEIESAGHSVLNATGIPVQYVAFNINLDCFKDNRVRQALNYAVDKESIIQTLLGGYAKPLSGPFGPGSQGYDESIKPYEFDPKKARELLAAAGYANGFEVTLSSPQGRYLNDTMVCEAVAQQWSEVGVRTKIQTFEWGTYVQGIVGKTHDCFFMQHGGVPEENPTKTHLSGRTKGAAWQGYVNDQVDQLIDDAPKTMDDAARRAKYVEIQKLVREDAPWLFMYNQDCLVGRATRVSGFEPDPMGRVLLGKSTI